MKEYSTSEIAKVVGIHPNTVRFYEEICFLPTIPRKSNGYRVYTQVHLEQLKLIKIALKTELLQNGLRKQVINIIKICAKGDYYLALQLANKHLEKISEEEINTRDSIYIVKNYILNIDTKSDKIYTRQQLSSALNITIDTLRNWELNGLLNIKRKENGYRVYTQEDIKRIKIIRSLRCANFSLSSILRLLNDLDKSNNTNLEYVLDTPKSNEDIVSACDKLLTSLTNAKKDTEKMIKQIKIITQLEK